MGDTIQSPYSHVSNGLKSPNSVLGTTAFHTVPSPSRTQPVIRSEPLITTCSPGAAVYVMRLRSQVPPFFGSTHSRYSPACTITVSPGIARSAARWIVANGRSFVPGLRSEPDLLTWYSVPVVFMVSVLLLAWAAVFYVGLILVLRRCGRADQVRVLLLRRFIHSFFRMAYWNVFS